jgi:hypothetical protein
MPCIVLCCSVCKSNYRSKNRTQPTVQNGQHPERENHQKLKIASIKKCENKKLNQIENPPNARLGLCLMDVAKLLELHPQRTQKFLGNMYYQEM